MQARVQVAVVGGGVSGLNVARQLSAAGVSFELFEAKDRLGGRVLTVNGDGAPAEDGYDLGPSWFWPRLQPAIGDLVRELGLASFVQSSQGDVIFERMSREPAQRYTGVQQAGESMRLSGGTGMLISALLKGLPQDRIHLNSPVVGLALQEDGVNVGYRDAAGDRRSIGAEYVAVALPPRILEATIAFSPEPEPETIALWKNTPTWMAAQAKFVALYETPFWRVAGLSGTAQSMVGPMVEMHDATTQSGAAALFGFLGMSPGERQRVGEQALIEACIAQFERIFGAEARRPTSTMYKDWAADPRTATSDDLASSGHPDPATSWVHGRWAQRLVLAASEVSPKEAGYLAGAIEASALAAEELRRRVGT